MFWVTRYPMIFKTELGRVGYRKKYRVAGRVRVPAGHWPSGLKESKFFYFTNVALPSIVENAQEMC